MGDRIDELNAKLDALSKAIASAYNDLQEAEAEWLPKFDAVAEVLREECREAGRKSDPAEHTVLSAARHKHPDEYVRWRNARHEVHKLETIAQNRRSELSGQQTKLRESGKESEGSSADRRGAPQHLRGRQAA